MAREFLATSFTARTCLVKDAAAAAKVEEEIRTTLARLPWLGVAPKLEMGMDKCGYYERSPMGLSGWCRHVVTPTLTLIDSETFSIKE